MFGDDRGDYMVRLVMVVVIMVRVLITVVVTIRFVLIVLKRVTMFVPL